MTTMSREAWTDERLDDLSAKLDKGFAHVDLRFDKVEGRSDDLTRTLLLIGGTIVAGLVGAIVAIVGVALTQL